MSVCLCAVAGTRAASDEVSWEQKEFMVEHVAHVAFAGAREWLASSLFMIDP